VITPGILACQQFEKFADGVVRGQALDTTIAVNMKKRDMVE
jgi:hypothetical protein